MDTFINYFIQRKINEAVSDMNSIKSKCERAKTPRDIQQATMWKHIDPMVRSFGEVRQAKSQAEASAERKLRTLAEEDIRSGKMNEKLKREYLQVMRGDYPGLYYWLERECARMKIGGPT